SRMPKPPRGQSPRNMVMRLNAASGPKAFHHMESSGFSAGSSCIANPSRADFSAFREERSSTRERTLQTKKQIQKVFSVFRNELKTRNIAARNSDSPAILAKSGLRPTGLLCSNMLDLQEQQILPDVTACQSKKGGP